MLANDIQIFLNARLYCSFQNFPYSTLNWCRITTLVYLSFVILFQLLLSVFSFVDFDVLMTVHLSIFVSVINQLDAQNFCFTISLFHASTCFERMCSSSGGQNCIKQPLVSGCVMQFWPPDDDLMWSKHVEAWDKLILKQKFCTSSWLITEINILL